MKWIPLIPKGVGLIQVDISGHPPIPTGSSWQFFSLVVFSYFLGPELLGSF
jgi:hypothetical protein